MKNDIGDLVEIALNLQIALGNVVILTILILPIYEHSISFHQFMCSLIHFIRILQFLEYRSFISISMFIPWYLILFDAIIMEFFLEFFFLIFFFFSLQICNKFLCINSVTCNFTKFIDEVQYFFWQHLQDLLCIVSCHLETVVD